MLEIVCTLQHFMCMYLSVCIWLDTGCLPRPSGLAGQMTEAGQESLEEGFHVRLGM